jgi:ABC-2 type transport system ATP-binding protein
MMTRHITAVVSELADADRGVLLATHDLASVERVADTVVVLDRGSVVATGTPAALLDETDTETLDDALSALVSGETGEVATRDAATTAATDGRGDER